MAEQEQCFSCPILGSLRFIRGGVLLTGPEGLGQKTDAMILARKFLGDEPSGHPDYIDFDAIEEENRIDLLYQSLSMLPAKAERRIVYVPNIDQRGAAVQNRLLKVMEEADAFFICTAQGNTLRTVASRLMVIPYSIKPLSLHIKEGGSIPEWFSAGNSSVTPIFGDVYNAVMTGNAKGLLIALGLVREKDKKAFCEAFPFFVPALFCLIGKALYDRGDDFIKVEKAVRRAASINGRYQIPEFFSDIVGIV